MKSPAEVLGPPNVNPKNVKMNERRIKMEAKRIVEEDVKVVGRDKDMVMIVLRAQTGREDEIRTFRINRTPYHIKVGQAVEVPRFLAEHVFDLTRRKKLSALAVEPYVGDGRGLGDLK